MPAPPLIDTFNRTHDNLRISVTDRCNIRCFYCMPEGETPFAGRAEILSFEEIERFVRLAVPLGITKVRVTGGEPLLRKNLPALISKLTAIDGLREVALTTNALLLEEQAASLYRAGLRRLNVHLDTLDRGRFQRITRRDELDRALRGLMHARETGFAPIKINAVAMKGLTEPDVAPLAHFGRENGFEVRYIEVMPLDGQALWDRSRVLTMDEILAILRREVGPLEAVPDSDPRAPELLYRYLDGRGTAGFIASVSRPFCLNCNRVRLTADGKLRYCLFAIEETDVKGLLRGGASDEQIADAIRETVRKKWLGHEIDSASFVAPPRAMYAIGG
ncbi:MAG: GTP 3',8-cyclase MoaA [Bryobacteraceae bacterium]|jgi:cyclic pyranopterin phosphate synthase